MNCITNLMKRATTIFVFMLSVCAVAYAQQHPCFEVTIDQLQKHDDCVDIAYKVTIHTSEVSDCESVLLDFYLEKNEHKIDFKPILVNGQSRNRTYKRGVALHNLQRNYANADVISATDPDTEIVYTDCIPHEEWMNGSVLYVKQAVWGCGSQLTEKIFALKTLTVPPMKLVEPVVTVVEIVPEPQPQPRVKNGVAYLEFPVGRSVLDLSIGKNLQEWNKIIGEIRQIEKDEDARIISVEIIGYASPEGTYALNERLSRERAKALSNQILLFGNLSLSPDLVRSSSVAEDWDGLVKLLEERPLPYQHEIMRIIENIGIFDGREKAIMELAHGNVYRTLLKEYFPKLRRTEYRITYMGK